ncbi:unnamed protein product [Rangifer tarandus platyrhynchus]|uniref:Uncharacterized protein n=1 Tax=Rangifer tarandus platyrhynchus TaxID=3082113 RepID=A0ABN8YXX7_RANTA|nr:unnamed protein product [Rangifer tarandus platyrhynchus]
MDAKVSPRPVNLGHACITGSDHWPKDNVTTHFPRPRFSSEGSQTRSRSSRSAALSAPLGLWFQATQAMVNSSSPPAPWSSAHPDADSLKRPKTTRPKLTSDVQIPFRERPSTRKRESQHSGPKPAADPRRAPLRMRRTGPVRTWASPREGARGPAAVPEVLPGLAKEPGAWTAG